MRKHLFFLSLGLALVLGCNQQRGNEPSGSSNQTSSRTDVGEAKTSTGGPVASGAQDFVTEAASGGMKEVELGNLVAQKTKNADVKQLAERIAQDHQSANRELQTAAKQDNAEVPTTMNGEAMQEIERFKKLSGSKLDHAYVESMIDDHKKDVAKFQEQANNGAAPQVKAFAQKTLPTLQDHLKMAEDAQSKLGK